MGPHILADPDPRSQNDVDQTDLLPKEKTYLKLLTRSGSSQSNKSQTPK